MPLDGASIGVRKRFWEILIKRWMAEEVRGGSLVELLWLTGGCWTGTGALRLFLHCAAAAAVAQLWTSWHTGDRCTGPRQTHTFVFNKILKSAVIQKCIFFPRFVRGNGPHSFWWSLVAFPADWFIRRKHSAASRAPKNTHQPSKRLWVEATRRSTASRTSHVKRGSWKSHRGH